MLQQIKGYLAQDSQVLRAMVLADTVAIFPKGNVQESVQPVFDTPMLAGGLQEGLGLPGPAAAIVAGLDRGLCGLLPQGRHLRYGARHCLLPRFFK